MTSEDAAPDAGSGGRNSFATTHWSLVVAARDRSVPEASAALAELCRAYWYPLYAYMRRQGRDPDQAQDLTQEFFARFLEKDFLAAVEQDKGKFRSFLLAACRHFLANESDRARAQKRGGGRVLPLDLTTAEGRYGSEPYHTLTPERLFERRWALTLLERVLTRLQEEACARGKGAQFEQLRVFLLGAGGQLPSQAEAAAALGMTEGAVKVAVHRWRGRYREMLREEIAQTVAAPDQIDEEVRQLFDALGP
jgi:RNA polymerase sigma-70 factor (ECF subfamily)